MSWIVAVNIIIIKLYLLSKDVLGKSHIIPAVYTHVWGLVMNGRGGRLVTDGQTHKQTSGECAPRVNDSCCKEVMIVLLDKRRPFKR